MVVVTITAADIIMVATIMGPAITMALAMDGGDRGVTTLVTTHTTLRATTLTTIHPTTRSRPQS